MKYEYILCFKNSRPSKMELFHALERELDSFGIHNSQDSVNSELISIIYQEHEYQIRFEKFENFPQTLIINTNVEYYLNSRVGFITLLWRLMHSKFKVDYGDMEILERQSFDLINERFAQRFIDQSKLHILLQNSISTKASEFKITDFDELQLTHGTIPKESYTEVEEAWISFARKLEYDDWDIVNVEFLPISLEEYYTQTKEFLNSWNANINLMDLELTSEIVSILQIEKSWNFLEYIIKTNHSVDYVSARVWTP